MTTLPESFIKALPPAESVQEASRFMTTDELFEVFYDMNEGEDLDEMKDFKKMLRDAGYKTEYIEGLTWLIK